jgi:hypothetical protein
VVLEVALQSLDVLHTSIELPLQKGLLGTTIARLQPKLDQHVKQSLRLFRTAFERTLKARNQCDVSVVLNASYRIDERRNAEQPINVRRQFVHSVQIRVQVVECGV